MQIDVSTESGNVKLTITPSTAAENALLQVAHHRDSTATALTPVTDEDDKFDALVITFSD